MKQVFILVLFLFTLNLYSQSNSNFVERIIGEWNGIGLLFNNDATFKMNWKKVHNNHFLELSFQNKYINKSGKERVMTATGVYNLKLMKGVWYDSRGVILPLTLSINTDTLTVEWGDENTERGKSIYKLIGKDKIEVKDFYFNNDKYIPFGKADYLKSKK